MGNKIVNKFENCIITINTTTKQKKKKEKRETGNKQSAKLKLRRGMWDKAGATFVSSDKNAISNMIGQLLLGKKLCNRNI